MTKKHGFDPYKDKKGEWRWRYRAVNGRIVAEGGEGYKKRSDCIDGFEAFATGLVISGIYQLIQDGTIKVGKE